jgi:hypothetical protein
MTNSLCQIPWNDIGIEHARGLVASSDELTRTFRKALAGVSGPGIPDFDDPRWRYEFHILTMFWLWYVANSPKFTGAGVTKPLLDAYHRGCYQAFLQEALIEKGEEASQRWQDDLKARFLGYEEIYDRELIEKRQDPHLRITGRGSVGWRFAQYLFPAQQPSIHLIVLLNEFGSSRFTGLVEMFNRLEAHYCRTKP